MNCAIYNDMCASLHFVDENDSLVQTKEELSMARGNIRHFMTALGYDPEFEALPPIPIREFSKSVEQYRSSDLGEFIDIGVEIRAIDGFTFFGKREGYLEPRMEVASEMIEEAEGKGATSVRFI